MKELEAVDGSYPRFDALITESTASHPPCLPTRGTRFPSSGEHPGDELVQIGRKAQAAKKLAPTRPHPAAPNAELFDKVQGQASA